MNRGLAALVSVLALSVATAAAWASDPPHDATRNIQCTSCHNIHAAPGASLTAVAGNANLCASCHVAGGLASAKALAPNDQALPGPNLPAGTNPAGTSHRWDSGPAGHVVFGGGAPTPSTGKVAPLGAYTGPYAKAYTLTITTAGNVGVARFSWTATSPGGGSGTNVLTSASAALDQGVSVKFVDGTGVSFQLNDKWVLYVLPELRTPTNTSLSQRLENGQVMCSTCHNQHVQAAMPFDPAARSGGLKHFQRIANDTGQMCVDCHNPRNVTATGGPSHPIALPVPGTGDYKTPTTAVLDAASKVQCQSCHKVHYSPTADGTLLRVSNAANQLCDDCHTTRTVANKGVHFDATLGVVWPGGQYGTPASTYAARTTAERGNCVNCHDPHGWPDARNTTQHYAKLLGDDRTNLCLACHDATPQGAAPNVNTEITKANHHPIERTSGRTVRCLDCHNAHKALKGSHTYSTTATSTRNAVSNVLKSVPGVTPTWGGIWAAPSAYTTTASAAYEYQICFKCHTSHDSFGTTRPGGVTTYYATGTAKFTNGSTTVAGTGTTWTSAMVGMYIQKDVASPAYRITAATATSITLANAYTGTTDATAAAYKITRQQTDLAVEFNPANRSGHPVVTGLNNYTGSPAPKALATTYLKAPWNSNVGTQTMMCSDCHNTDGAAAQGPHGSAAQFMLKGTNPANWPNVTLTNFSTSWCANCHNNFTSGPHGSNHSSYACWNCHTVIPHGSKRSRLIGDRTNMPARYAYNNTLTNMPIQGFKKATSPTTYQKNYCQASCASDHSTAVSGSEVW